MGDRLSKSSSLSDLKVIDLLNREFNAMELNVTDQGFPAWLAALAPWKKVYETSHDARMAFFNVVVLDPEGTFLIATGDNGKFGGPSDKISVDYDPPRFLKVLELAVARNARLEAARRDEALMPEASAAAVASIRFEVQQDMDRLFAPEPAFLRILRLSQQ